MKHLIGRKKELHKLKQYAASPKSDFIAIYGRRRVGKTYLVRELFEGQFAFQLTGLGHYPFAGFDSHRNKIVM